MTFYSEDWWLKRASSSAEQCDSGPHGPGARARVRNLSGNTQYTVKAYSDSSCMTELTFGLFLTKPGKPKTPEVTAGGGSGTLKLSSSLPDNKNGSDPLEFWEYQWTEEGGDYGDHWERISQSSNNETGIELDYTVSQLTTNGSDYDDLTNGTKYQFRVRAVNATGDGLESDPSVAVAPVDETLTAGSVGATEATLTIAGWDNKVWHYKQTSPSGGACSAEVDADTSTADLTGLSGNTHYTFKAYSDGDCTEELAAASPFLTKPGKSKTPEVTAGGGSGTLKLSSSLPDNKNGSDPLEFWEYQWTEEGGDYGDHWERISQSSNNETGIELDYTVSQLTTNGSDYDDLTNGTKYQFRVRAVNATGDGLESDPSVAVAPVDETLTAGSVGATEATLTIAGWDNKVWHYKQTSPSGGACSAEVDADTSTADLTGLSGNTHYTFKAYSDGDCTEELAAASPFLTKPGKPKTPEVTAGGGSGTLKLSSSLPDNKNGSDPLEFWEYQWTEEGGDYGDHWERISQSSNNETGIELDYTVSQLTTNGSDYDDLTNGTKYQFRVRAVNATGDGLESDPSVAVAPVDETLTAGSVGATEATLTIAGWDNKVWHYKQTSPSGGACSAEVDADTSTADLTGLSGNTHYTFSAYSDSSCMTELANVQFLTTSNEVSNQTLTAGSLGATKATLIIAGWDNKVWHYKQTSPSGGTCSGAIAAGTSKADLTGLSGNTDYTFSAYSKDGCPEEAELAAAPQFLTKPGQPTTPTVAINENAGELTLSSSLPEDKNGTAALTKWQYQMKEGNVEFGDDDRWIDITETSMKLNHTVKNLDNYRSYQFRVRAVNKAGEGLASDGSAATSRADGKLTGADAALNAWLGPFGRTIAMQTVDVLSQRFATPANTQFTLGGESIPLTLAGKDLVHGWADEMSFSARNNEVRAMSDEDLVFGSSFHLTQEGEEGPEGRWSVWGRASFGRMEDSDGGVAVSGEVATGVLGADWERGRWLAGLALTRSEGEGNLRQHGGRKRVYESESTMTSISPYLRLRLSERLLVWGLAGGGRGDLTMEEKVAAGAPVVYGTDLRMTLAAAGLQSDLFTPDETGGYGLAVKGDAFWVRIKSDAMVSETGTALLSATSADSSRFRLALEGSRPFRLEDGATLTPLVEVGVRHDAGDDETGAGLDVGGGFAYSGPGSRMRVELRAQTLLLHADRNRREWGLSGSFRLLADERGRGLAVSIAHGRGADIGGSDRLWNADAATGLLVGDTPSSDSLETEVGYGLSAFGGRLTQTPYLGFGDSDGNQSMRLGWRLTAPTGLFETSLEALRRRKASGSSDNGIGLLATARW